MFHDFVQFGVDVCNISGHRPEHNWNIKNKSPDIGGCIVTDDDDGDDDDDDDDDSVQQQQSYNTLVTIR